MKSLGASVILLAWIAVFASLAQAADNRDMTPEPPVRSVGLSLGDIVGQTLPLGDDETIADWQVRLPEGRTGTWLERLPLRETRDRHGARGLRVEYQIVNSPDGHVRAELPRVDDGAGRVIPAWPITIAALDPLSESPVGDPSMLAAGPAQAPADTAVAKTRLRQALLALGVVLAAWLSWFVWRGWRDRQVLPFAQCLRDIGALPRSGREDNPRAWQAIHRALDLTARQPVTSGNVDHAINEAAWLRPHRERLLEFLAASNGRFFSLPPSTEPFAVTDFGRTLARAERRQA